jgi:carbamoylphosphate synthase large subunit
MQQIKDHTKKIARFKNWYLINVQFAIKDELYIIEANPRALRTVPFIESIRGTLCELCY